MRTLSEAIGALTPSECSALVDKMLRTADPALTENARKMERLRDPAVMNDLWDCTLFDRVVLVNERTVILLGVHPTDVRRAMLR